MRFAAIADDAHSLDPRLVARPDLAHIFDEAAIDLVMISRWRGSRRPKISTDQVSTLPAGAL